MNVQGIESDHVTDATKIVCSYCGSPELMLSSTMDDPNDITEDTDFAALLITFASGKSCQGLVGLCPNCGHEQVPFWYLLDVADSNGTTLTMTNLDQATTANLLAGIYMVCLVGTDVGKYFIVGTNTAAAPTVITTTVAPNADADGYFLITNVLPLGFTLAT